MYTTLWVQAAYKRYFLQINGKNKGVTFVQSSYEKEMAILTSLGLGRSDVD